jgi:hypothetical protein
MELYRQHKQDERYREIKGEGKLMREDQKHLVEVPLKQLSRLSKLVMALRSRRDELSEYKSFEEFKNAVRRLILHIYDDATLNGNNKEWDEVLKAIGDLISEAVWPK